MERLAALDASQYAAVPGSRPSLEALTSVVFAASIAASNLASALEANPLEGAAFPGPPADEAAVRTARHAEAVPAMAEHLADAAHQLDLAYTGCYYLASGITRDLKQHAEQQQETPVPEITASQYAVLARLSAGGGTRYVISRHGVLKAIDKDRATGSQFAKRTSEQGILPPEVWLAVGRAANELLDIGLDLDEHTKQLAAHLPAAALDVLPRTTHALPIRHAALISARIARLAAEPGQPHHPQDQLFPSSPPSMRFH